MYAKISLLVSAVAALMSARVTHLPDERFQSFDRDPGWEAVNNRSKTPEPRQIRQDFGYSATNHAGGAKGEIGGIITPSGEVAYYAKRLSKKTLETRLISSGTFAATTGSFHVMLGYFNSGTLNEWRTPNSVVIRLLGRGEHFIAYLEYCNSRWQANGDSPQGFSEPDPKTGKNEFIPFPIDKPLRWTLEYDPTANQGKGAVLATIDGRKAICNVEQTHRTDGASFDRFGLMNVVKSADGGGEVWLDDVTIDGETDKFNRDPGWEARNNRATYMTNEVRFRFDFGYSPTNYAGGAKGELGGNIFRGDGRHANTIAWYADRIGPLAHDKPIKAGGKIAFRRGVSDSTTLIGFFNSKTSTKVSDAQGSGIPDDFLGVAIEGPSAEGFFAYPCYRLLGDSGYNYGDYSANRILPDGKPHSWSFEYLPGEGGGLLRVRLDDQQLVLRLDTAHRATKPGYDRFGIITTRIDGNAQQVYFDDLRYTVGQ
jgi:hypothetical protein